MKMSDVQYVKNDIFWDSSNRFRSVGMTALCAWVGVKVFRLVEGYKMKTDDLTVVRFDMRFSGAYWALAG